MNDINDMTDEEFELAKFKAHSIMLNKVAYKIACALDRNINKATAYYGNVESDVDQLISEYNRMKEELASS